MPLNGTEHNSAHLFASTEVFPLHFKDFKRRPKTNLRLKIENLIFKVETL